MKIAFHAEELAMSIKNRWGGFRTKKEMLVGLPKLPIKKRTPINYAALNSVPSMSGEAYARYLSCSGHYKKQGATPRKGRRVSNAN
jgi:hypothetical protein